MGEDQNLLFQPDFNRAIKVQTSEQKITSHAGALLLRQLDHQLGLIESLAECIRDPRDPTKIRYTVAELLRERIYALALGHENQDDLDRLAHDPAMRMAAWDRPGENVLDERLASQPTQSRMIDWMAAPPQNIEALRHSLGDWAHRHLRSTNKAGGRAVMRMTIDIDSFPMEVCGEQKGAAYNGYYRETVYHPLVASYSVHGDYDSTRAGHRLGNGFLHAILRQGQVHTAQGSRRFMRHVIEQARGMARNFDLRLDAGFTIGAVMDMLSDENVRFCGRLRNNSALDRLAEPHLSRPVGRPPSEGYLKVVELGRYHIDGWKHSQRLILAVVDRPDPRTGQLNLLPQYFFLITNWPPALRSGAELLAHYRKRGTFEDRLGEFKDAIGPHLSSRGFEENEVTMLLSLLAFNMVSMLRNEFEAVSGGSWDLRRFRETVLRAGGRVVKHARRLWLHIEECVGSFWRTMVGCLSRLRLASRWESPRGASRRRWVPPPSHAHLTLVLRE
jgi:hypothetical protein